MQWTHEGGFTTGDPWLPYGDLARNVQEQTGDPKSLLSFYRSLAWLRRKSAALSTGGYAPLDGTPESVFAYIRSAAGERLLTVLNFSNDAVAFDLPGVLEPTEYIIGTHEPALAGRHIALAGNEGRLLRLA
jgi:glycosidase